MGGGSSGLVKLRSGWVGRTQAVGMVRPFPAWASSAAAAATTVAGAPGTGPTPGTCSVGGAEEPGRRGVACWGGGCCWRRGFVEVSVGIAEKNDGKRRSGLVGGRKEREWRQGKTKYPIIQNHSVICKKWIPIWRKDRKTLTTWKTNSRTSKVRMFCTKWAFSETVSALMSAVLCWENVPLLCKLLFLQDDSRMESLCQECKCKYSLHGPFYSCCVVYYYGLKCIETPRQINRLHREMFFSVFLTWKKKKSSYVAITHYKTRGYLELNFVVKLHFSLVCNFALFPCWVWSLSVFTLREIPFYLVRDTCERKRKGSFLLKKRKSLTVCRNMPVMWHERWNSSYNQSDQKEHGRGTTSQ